ncbi:hypothetical protein [Desulfonema magnum]|uniref:Dockerin domain-containing protein n=1 Tax=Desulfonema magnum TaxID=45655 RepID=A0A975BQ37_9BACT|nr:hypothetical protein [Desulfonema magnum]QTA89298.1 Uncharacterized protein dnm_053480 [Desulfonema magnum]
MFGKKIAMSVVLSLCFFASTVLGQETTRDDAGIPLPFRIGGTVEVNGVQITNETDAGYVFTVTKPDGTSFISANGDEAEDTDGLNEHNCYIIDIPIYNKDSQPEGAEPGEPVVIHAIKDGVELPVVLIGERRDNINVSAKGQQLTVGESGDVEQIDLIVVSLADVINMLKALIAKDSGLPYVDMNEDNKIDLRDIIYGLNYISEMGL